MSDEETEIDVTPIKVEIGGYGTFTMFVYEFKGRRCVTFGEKGSDGIYVTVPFPMFLVTDESLRESIALLFEDCGYQLTSQPEQLFSRQ